MGIVATSMGDRCKSSGHFRDEEGERRKKTKEEVKKKKNMKGKRHEKKWRR